MPGRSLVNNKQTEKVELVTRPVTPQNEEAEELMRKIEKEEEQLAYEDPDKKVFHLCIVNLVIG